jgi:hypothetical protein
MAAGYMRILRAKCNFRSSSDMTKTHGVNIFFRVTAMEKAIANRIRVAPAFPKEAALRPSKTFAKLPL